MNNAMSLSETIVALWATAWLACLPFAVSSQESVRLGTPVSEEALADFDLISEPGGEGFPPGNGTAREGKSVYNSHCASCHGLNGEGISGRTLLAGGNINSGKPPRRTVGSYWPYASTLFDYVRRAMPADSPKSLSNGEVYQVVAYVLYLNGLVGENESLNASTLPRIEMPNAEGFIDRSMEH